MMVGYKLENTLTDNGHVARGVCVTDEEGYLKDINERTHIEKREGGAAYTEDDGVTWTELPMDATVSMNMWDFCKHSERTEGQIPIIPEGECGE
mgnify:CR=1 FL=1